jgi:lactoylglutathione lyase
MPVGTRNTTIAGCGLHHVSLQTRDLDASLRLYREVLGMKVVAEGGSPERRIFLLDMGDGSHMELLGPLPGAVPPGAGDHAPIAHLALTTTDIQSALERVRDAGYKVTRELCDVTMGDFQATIAFFQGPDGEAVELWQSH